MDACRRNGCSGQSLTVSRLLALNGYRVLCLRGRHKVMELWRSDAFCVKGGLLAEVLLAQIHLGVVGASEVLKPVEMNLRRLQRAAGVAALPIFAQADVDLMIRQLESKARGKHSPQTRRGCQTAAGG